MDFGWIAPICKVSYAQKFLLNTILMPLGLQALVYATWWFSKRDEKQDTDDDSAPKDKAHSAIPRCAHSRCKQREEDWQVLRYQRYSKLL